MNNYKLIKEKTIDLPFIQKYCTVVINSECMDDDDKVTNGYFVNEVYRTDDEDNIQDIDRNLYINFLCPDVILLKKNTNIKDVIHKCRQYAVAFVPDDQLGDKFVKKKIE